MTKHKTPREERGILYIVATPIGNLEDITLRALRILKDASVIYAEDTRVTTKLLSRYQIKVPLQRLDAAMEARKIGEVVERLRNYENVAFVSDAGTPGISDPGTRLVAGVRAAMPEARIEAIPGASALVAALSVAGVPADSFTFLGFLPHKKGRQTMLDALTELQGTVVLYESPHRIVKLVEEIAKRTPARQAVLCQEITKLFESTHTGTVAEIAEKLQKGDIPARGEFVVILGP